MIGNVTRAPNLFLKAIWSDTYLCQGNVNFGDVFSGANVITGLYASYDSGFTTPIHIPLSGTVKKVLVRVFTPDSPTPPKFVAHANLVGTLFGTPLLNPRLFLKDGDEIEIYGISQIKRLRVMPDNFTGAPFLISISLFN